MAVDPSSVSAMPAISPDRLATGTAPRNAGFCCALAVLCVALLIPLTVTDVPPLLDYPNHLARLFVLASLPDDPVLARFYTPHWAVIPNLALDLTVPPLLRIFPVHLVGRVVVALTVLLPVLGSVAYHRALTGRLAYWPLGSALFAFNGLLLKGFLNFIASVGLAMLLAAAWIEWRDRRPTIAIVTCVAGATALFFCHLDGLLLFAVLIGSHELLIMRTDPVGPGFFRERIPAIVAVFAVPVALYAASDLGRMPDAAQFRTIAGKAHAALIPMLNYCWPLDLVTAVLCAGTVGLLLARRWCAMKLRAVTAIIVLLVLFAVSPDAFKGGFDIDTRFVVMAAFIVPAALVPVALPRQAAWTIGLGFLAVFSVRMIVLAAVWHDWAGELAAFRTVIAEVRPGDVVLTVRVPDSVEQNPWTSVATARHLSDGTVLDAHLPALLLIEHRAWWPFLFDNQSQQPIETREPFRTLAERIDAAPDPIALLASNAPESRLVTHMLLWGHEPVRSATQGLQLQAVNSEAALFAVERGAIRPSPPRAPPPDH